MFAKISPPSDKVRHFFLRCRCPPRARVIPPVNRFGASIWVLHHRSPEELGFRRPSIRASAVSVPRLQRVPRRAEVAAYRGSASLCMTAASAVGPRNRRARHPHGACRFKPKMLSDTDDAETVSTFRTSQTAKPEPTTCAWRPATESRNSIAGNSACRSKTVHNSPKYF